MSFGTITTAPCINTTPPPDTRCSDPAYALAHPEVCPAAPTLRIQPEVTLVCTLGSIQFSAIFTKNGVEEDVTAEAVWESSNPDIAVVGAASGNATGIAEGSTTITVTYEGMTASSDFTVLGTDCCDDISVAMMVVVDKTKSMSQQFGGAYTTKLVFAKQAASDFISEVNGTKDLVGLMSFTEKGYTVHSSPVANVGAVEALVSNITQTQQLTQYYDALEAAINELNGVSVDRRVLVLISDGVDIDDSYDSSDNPIELLSDFKAAGGIVICLGVRCAGAGYSLMSAFSTGGFFVNAYNAVSATALAYFKALKCYVCAGSNLAGGDEYKYLGALNYAAFANWDVVDGHVDLMGEGSMDLLPSNGLYVDLAGSKPQYSGTMLLKTGIAVEAGKTYRLSVDVAGNQRINLATNAIRLQVFERNTDSITDPVAGPTATPTDSGAALASNETYYYAYSYVNANGETELSPPSTATITTEDGTVALSAPVEAAATLVRFWRTTGELPTSRYYLIAEVAAATPTMTDSDRAADLIAKVLAGTVDSSVLVPSQNSTGTPIYLINQQVVINNFQQDFTTLSYSAVAPNDGTVWIALKQTATPIGYESIGLLLDNVAFECVTDGGAPLFADDFDAENETYVPPDCGVGTIPILTGGAVLPAVADPTTITPIESVALGGGFAAFETTAFAISLVTAEGETTCVQSIYPCDSSQTDPWYLQTGNLDAVKLTLPVGLDPRVTAINIYRLTGDPVAQGDYVMGPDKAYPDYAPYFRLRATVAAGTTEYTDALGNVAWLSIQPSTTAPLTNTTQGSGSYGYAYGYAYGYDCYGYGCLSTTIGAQSQDPDPQSNIESGYTPPGMFTSSKTACLTCDTGFVQGWTTDGVQELSFALDWDVGIWNYDIGSVPTQLIVTGNFQIGALYALRGSDSSLAGTYLGGTVVLSGTVDRDFVLILDIPAGTTFKYFQLWIRGKRANPVVPGPQLVIITNRFFTISSSNTVCATATETSEISQAHADQLAQASATAAAQALLHCIGAYTSTQSYTAVCDVGTFGANVTKTVTVTSYLSMADAIARALNEATIQALAELDCTLSNNGEGIDILDNAKASPYPSVQHFAGLGTSISAGGVKLKIYGLTHAYPDDIRIMLMAPSGTTAWVMANCGGPNAISGVDLEIYDAAASSLPDATVIASGSFKPTTYPTTGSLPSPAPAAPYGASFAVFAGEDPNGSWALFCFDDSAGEVGSIESWSLVITAT